MARPQKNPDELSPYMKRKLEKLGEEGAGQPGIKHRVVTKKHASPEVIAARNASIHDPGDPYVKKLRKIYALELESGVEGVTCKCHYQGLTGLAQSYHNPHPEIKRIMDMHYDSLPRGDKDAIAAFGYEVLMGNVQGW